MKRFIILISILLIPLIVLVLFLLGVIKPSVRTPRAVNLLVWTMRDNPEAYKELISAYNQIRPYVKISVERVSAEDYANQLKDAWARGKGPDVFELPASWIGEFTDDFILPIPEATKVFTYATKRVFFRREIQIQETTIPSITTPQLQSSFVDVVFDDVVRDGKIYGLPLSIDTLSLYYNRDLLRSANIVEPPRTWGQLANVAPKLTIADQEGKLLQSAIPLGTAENVLYSPDIISLLFLQDGVTMSTPEGRVLLDESEADEGTNLGVNALSFYTSFANPNKETYSWNAEQPNSREAFIRGKAALFIGYGADRKEIESASSINLGVAPIPHLQTDGKDALLSPAGVPLQVNYGNYTVLSVFQRTRYPNEAWNFVQFLTRQEQVAGRYLTLTKRVGALRSILQKQVEDPELGVFAQQAVSTRSWYHGRDATAVEQYLKNMIEGVSQNKTTPLEALAIARKQIELTLKKRP